MVDQWEIEDIKKIARETHAEVGSVKNERFGEVLDRNLREYYTRRKELEKNEQ